MVQKSGQWTENKHTLVWVLILLFSSCMTAGKPINFSRNPLPHYRNERVGKDLQSLTRDEHKKSPGEMFQIMHN